MWIKNSNPYFGHKTFKDPRIKVINKFYTFDEIAKFYTLLDCFVFPSHAEGSGLPPREAMATGLPVILTDWSGLSEVAQYGYPLKPISIDHPDFRGEEQPGFMAKIDVREMMSHMRYCFSHRESAIKKGRMASEFIHKEFSWDSCASHLLRQVKSVLEETNYA